MQPNKKTLPQNISAKSTPISAWKTLLIDGSLLVQLICFVWGVHIWHVSEAQDSLKGLYAIPLLGIYLALGTINFILWLNYKELIKKVITLILYVMVLATFAGSIVYLAFDIYRVNFEPYESMGQSNSYVSSRINFPLYGVTAPQGYTQQPVQVSLFGYVSPEVYEAKIDYWNNKTSSLISLFEIKNDAHGQSNSDCAVSTCTVIGSNINRQPVYEASGDSEYILNLPTTIIELWPPDAYSNQQALTLLKSLVPISK